MESWKTPCHSCARRRLRCDRSRPSCYKCTGSGFLCPGYDRVFTWIQGGLVRTRRNTVLRSTSQTACGTVLGNDSSSASNSRADQLTGSAPFVPRIHNLGNLELGICNIDGPTLQYLKHCKCLKRRVYKLPTYGVVWPGLTVFDYQSSIEYAKTWWLMTTPGATLFFNSFPWH